MSLIWVLRLLIRLPPCWRRPHGKVIVRSLIGGILEVLNKSPVPLSGRYGQGFSVPFGTGDADDKALATMESNSTVFAIVHRTTEALAAVDWRLYRKARSGLEQDRTPVDSHPVLDLWNKPNPFFTRQAFVEYTADHLMLTGKTPWVLERNGLAPPTEIWPVLPNRIKPVKDPDMFQSGWYYELGYEKIPLELTEVIRPKVIKPSDPYEGISVLASLGVDLDSSGYAAEYNKMFFINGAEPGGIAQVDRRLSDDEFNELRTRWAEQHKGVSKAHRIAVLENGLQWVERKYTNRDMQFTELRADSREVIREGYGMPKSVLGTTEDVNRANAEAGMVLFARWLLVGTLERYKGALNHELLPMFGKASAATLEFDYDSPVPEDVERENAVLTTKVTAAVQLVGIGFEPAAVLSALDLPPLPFVGAPRPVAPPVPDQAPTAALNGHGVLTGR